MSGRRAAENTNTTPNDARCIWLTEKHARALISATVDAQTLIEARQEMLAAIDRAPADPAEAARAAAWDLDATAESQPYPHETADAVLVALGLRRQDNPTP